MTDSVQAPALTGRELARSRRAEMSRTGGAKIKAAGRKPRAKVASVAAPTSQVVESAAVVDAVAPANEPIQAAVATDISSKGLSGKALSMARRAMLAKGGKSTLPSKPADVGRRKPAQDVAASSVPAEEAEACCDACADEKSAKPCDSEAEKLSNNAELDSLCELIDSDAQMATDASLSVKALCRQRRNNLSKKGKLALPGKAGIAARKSLVRGAGSSSSSLTGRAMAKMRREDMCVSGRGESEACRPSGRVRPVVDDAPAKVEVGTTLSGQSVTGTQVEQTDKITGVEAGTCRDITGTEYLGAEQFNNFCSTTPQPAEAKVKVSKTSHGQDMTGTNVAISDKVTGGEAGGCKVVTGSEYLGAEHFQSSCSTSKAMPSQMKVIEGVTAKNMSITGVDEARDNAVTGSESGSSQRVTGSEYVDMQTRTIVPQAPAKVALSHTSAGMPVSGGESSRISGITGDDQDLCGRVTGSEYVSSERFESACGTKAPLTPAKVAVDSNDGGMSITGNLVDRDKKVTGNEPGTCQRVTGNQYDSSARNGFCDQRSSKVHDMHTLSGRRLSGTEGSPSPKLTGDDKGSCSVVTGSEYVSREFFQTSCQQVPQAMATQTAMSRTWNGQAVSGNQPIHAHNTTGDERGICRTVTGNDAIGRDLMNEFCSNEAVVMSEQRHVAQNNFAAMNVSGSTPAQDPRLMGGFQRGACQSVTGAYYQGVQDSAVCNAQPMHHMVRNNQAEAAPVVAVEAYQSDFTVQSPAKSAWQQRSNDPVHTSVYAHRNSITGAVNKADGVISGTPEFRHIRDVVAPVAAQNVTSIQEDVSLKVITGEGSEQGMLITGDDWSRGGLVTGTEGLFSAGRNQTQQGVSVKRDNIGAHALKDRERPEAVVSKVTGGSGNSCKTGLVTLSGGASA